MVTSLVLVILANNRTASTGSVLEHRRAPVVQKSKAPQPQPQNLPKKKQ
jgi:hypothetical protein